MNLNEFMGFTGWIASLLHVFGLFLIGEKSRKGWWIYLVGQLFWAVYIYHLHLWPIVPLKIVEVGIALYNLKKPH
jgi:hypothetical protein